MRRAMVLTAVLAACSEDTTPPEDEPVNCALEDRDDDFAIGLHKSGDGSVLDFAIMTADPAPPAKYDNTWVIQINQLTSGVVGAPIDGASMIVTPYMPDHEHAAGKTVRIEPTGTEGQYELTPINFHMPGLWQTTIEATTPAGDDVVVFRFCIPS